ncbi:hypothetical protein E2C01_032756 [Portunus trituberculatus]|uniref:Uncharacterized protein n=1 Tax=Portunus trituberculatus TaxID=210409 RepID=A0A5B7F208_PORTR|nr:hypothetical protein [Portunus trituberculatus]
MTGVTHIEKLVKKRDGDDRGLLVEPDTRRGGKEGEAAQGTEEEAFGVAHSEEEGRKESDKRRASCVTLIALCPSSLFIASTFPVSSSEADCLINTAFPVRDHHLHHNRRQHRPYCYYHYYHHCPLYYNNNYY